MNNNITVIRLANGYLLRPDSQHMHVSYDSCIFQEGFDTDKLARNLQIMLVDKVTLEREVTLRDSIATVVGKDWDKLKHSLVEGGEVDVRRKD